MFFFFVPHIDNFVEFLLSYANPKSLSPRREPIEVYINANFVSRMTFKISTPTLLDSTIDIDPDVYYDLDLPIVEFIH